MRHLLHLALLLAASLSALHASAQDASLTVPQLTPEAQAYVAAASRNRIDTDVIYFDPTAEAPDLTTQERLETVETPESQSFNGPRQAWPYGLVAAIIVVGVIFLFARFGGSFGIVLQPKSENPHAARRTPRVARNAAAQPPRNLAQITGMKDRRAALILLTQNALRKAVSANGLLIQQSWTDRDALRRLPPDQHYLAELRDLVRASEMVQFGDRDVSEPEFAHHIAQMTPLFREFAA